MKVDKRNPRHWFYLATSGLWALVAVILRVFVPKTHPRRILLYGHKLNGNLLALYERLRGLPLEFDVAFLTLDPEYFRELVERGERVVLATSPRCVRWLASTHAIVSDHGLHALLPLLYLSDIRFIDVWHGIPFKGFDAADFRVQRRYDEAWVTSPLLKKVYVDQYRFEVGRVHATGNPRTDLVAGKGTQLADARRAFGLPESGKLILFAPTWKQDAAHRSLFPFGTTREEFLTMLSAVARKHGAVVALRMHLNSGELLPEPVDGIVQLPFARFPDTERLLVATDILVCDWSSIAFDFLVLLRPTIFLDVEPPFRKGFSLDASYRYGAVVPALEALKAALDRYLQEPDSYSREYGAYASEILERVYGGTNDGHAVDRCIERFRADGL